jgi:DEAD/DEAH box helicase domain-containing protein
MNTTNPLEVFSHVKEAYSRYYDSAFRIKYEKLLKERGELINSPGVAAQDMLIEAVLPYPGCVPVKQACHDAGLRGEIAPILSEIIFGSPDVNLRQHQAEALITSIKGYEGKKKYCSDLGHGIREDGKFFIACHSEAS